MQESRKEEQHLQGKEGLESQTCSGCAVGPSPPSTQSRAPEGMFVLLRGKTTLRNTLTLAVLVPSCWDAPALIHRAKFPFQTGGRCQGLRWALAEDKWMPHPPGTALATKGFPCP